MIASFMFGMVLQSDAIWFEQLDLHPTVGPDGTVYASTGGAYNASMVAIHADGSTKWKHKFDPSPGKFATGGNSLAPPTLSNDGATVYITGTDGFLYALNSENGIIEWKLESFAERNHEMKNGTLPNSIRYCWQDESSDCPLFNQVIVDEVGNLFFHGGQQLLALPPHFGASSTVDDISWSWILEDHFGNVTDDDGNPRSADFFLSTHMELSDGVLYVHSQKHFLAVNASNGDLLWSQPTGYDADAPRMASNGKLYGYSRALWEDGSDFLTLNESNVTVLKHFDEAGNMRVAIDADTIFVSTSSSVHAMHPDGTEKWVWSAFNFTQILEYKLSAPVVCGDVLYVGTGGSHQLQRSTLQALNVSTGAALWSVSPNFTSNYLECDSCDVAECTAYSGEPCCSFCWQHRSTTPSCSLDNEAIYFGATTGAPYRSSVFTHAVGKNGSVLWSYSDWDMPIVV